MKEAIYSKDFIKLYDKFYYDPKITKEEVKIKDLSEKYSIVGIDSSKDMISYAKKKCPKVRFKIMDMKNIKLKEKFDAVLMLGASFPYLITDSKIKKTLLGIKNVLKDNGLFIFSVNIKRDKKRFSKDNKFVKFEYDVKKDGNILWIKTKIYKKINKKYLKVLEDEKYIPRRIFTSSEIRGLLKENGFKIIFNKLIENQRFFVCNLIKIIIKKAFWFHLRNKVV